MEAWRHARVRLRAYKIVRVQHRHNSEAPEEHKSEQKSEQKSEAPYKQALRCAFLVATHRLFSSGG